MLNEKVYCPPIEIGQTVYLRNRPPGRNKIQDAWKPIPHRVVEIQGKTYRAEPVEGGPLKRVNRVDIRPCVSVPVTRAQKKSRCLSGPPVVVQEASLGLDEATDDGVVLEELIGASPGPSLSGLQLPAHTDYPEETMPTNSENRLESESAEHSEDSESELEVDPCEPEPEYEVESQAADSESEPTPVHEPASSPHRSQRSTAGQHSNLHHDPKVSVRPM